MFFVFFTGRVSLPAGQSCEERRGASLPAARPLLALWHRCT